METKKLNPNSAMDHPGKEWVSTIVFIITIGLAVSAFLIFG